MARKPNLEVIPRRPEVDHRPEPPPGLGERALGLWQRVLSEYEFVDPASVETLRQACELIDRADRLRRAIEADGEVARGRGGVLRAHPALATEIQARSLACRTLARLGLDLEPVRAGPGRPPGGYA